MFKPITTALLVIGIFSTISMLTPDSFVQGIDDVFIYLFSSLWALDGFVNIDTLFLVTQLLVNFIISLILFIIGASIIKHASQ